MVNIFKVKQIRDFGSLITGSFYYIRRHFRLLGKSILYFVVPLITVSGLLLIQYGGQAFELADASDPEIFLSNFMASALGSTLFTALAMTALAAVVYNHIKLVADENLSNEAIKIDDIWVGFKRDFFMILLISVAVFIVTIAGLIFFIIPGIYLSVKLVLATAAYVFEDTDLWGALSRSWSLTTDHWWTTFGLMIVIYIFVALMSYAISMPFFIVAAFTGFTGLESPETLETTFGIIYGLMTSLSYIFYTLLYVVLGLHYYNLVERKEGAGLQQRIDQIETANN